VNKFQDGKNTVREELAMSTTKTFGLTLGLLSAFTVALPLAHADEADQATRFTFSQPIRIPGDALPAGTYWFVLMDHGSDLKEVQVFDSDRSRLIATLYTEDAERLNASDQTILTLAEPEQPAESSSEPAALMSWFYPGSLEGHQFIYSSPLEKTLEHEHQVTITADSAGSIANADTGVK
jgi:hypothetical protein